MNKKDALRRRKLYWVVICMDNKGNGVYDGGQPGIMGGNEPEVVFLFKSPTSAQEFIDQQPASPYLHFDTRVLTLPPPACLDKGGVNHLVSVPEGRMPVL